MAVVGFDFTKIDAKKKAPIKGKININNNVQIKDVKEKDLSLGTTKKNSLQFTFEFIAKYEPNLGDIILEGNVVFMAEPKKVTEIMAGWKKDKKLPKEVSASILNSILNRCNIQALILSQVINLPPPIPLPKVQAGDVKE